MRYVLLALALTALSPAQAQRFSVASRQQDLNYVSTQVPKLHANFFYQLDRASFQQAADSLNSRIATLSDAEFYVQLAALIAMAGDAHTAIYLYGGIAAQDGFQSFPLQFRWLGDGVFVTAANSAYSRALGAQLVKVGGVPIDQVVQKLGAIVPHDNDQWLHYVAQSYLPGQQVLQGLGVLPASASSPLTFRTFAGDEFTMDVTPGAGALVPALSAAAGPMPDYLLNADSEYWFEYLAAQRLLYFKYNICGDDPANPFAAFTSSVMRAIDTNPIDTLVIDFRGNTGGAESFFADFGYQLAPRLVKLASNPNFRMYIVIDKGTFSSGMRDAMDFKSADLSQELAAVGAPSDIDIASRIFTIGEPTGGKPFAYGQVTPFTLPGSGLPGQYSTQFFQAPNGIPDAPSFAPDIPVTVRPVDYFARYDPVLAAIFARTDRAAAAPSGAAIAVNGASFRADQGVAPGSLAAAFGTFSTTPGQVLVDGAAATIVSAAATQVNFIVPAAAQAGRAAISIRAGGSEIASGQVTIAAAGPGIFVLNPADPSQPGAVENQDYAVNSASTPAARGSAIQIFATGYGPLDSAGAAPVQVMLGDTPLQVLYSAPLPQYPGLWQIDALLPGSASGQAPVYLLAGAVASNAVTIWIR